MVSRTWFRHHWQSNLLVKGLVCVLIITGAWVLAAALLGEPSGEEAAETTEGDAGGTQQVPTGQKPPTTAGLAADAEHFWPQWRGPLATGVAPHANPPVRWSETENVRWKRELPGRGLSTPVLWEDHLFITTAVSTGKALEPMASPMPGAHDNTPVTHLQDFQVLALDRRDGRLLWSRSVHREVPQDGAHYSASYASHSPVTDGERVYAYFGSHGLYCLDFAGVLLWKKDLGVLRIKHGHGEGSSPVLHGSTLVVNQDHEGQSILIALDKRTGKELWKVERDEVTSWASPIVVEHRGKAQLIVSGTNRLRSYDLASGKEIWQSGGLSGNVVASPVAGGGMVFAGSSYEIRSFLAIRLEGAQGDITGTDQVVWSRHRGTPYVPSPLLYEGSLYFLRHYQGILTRLEARTGADQPGALRLRGVRNIYSSPVAAAGRVYITDMDGNTLVMSHGERPETLALNHLDDRFSASAALVGDDLFLRGERFLYCLAAGMTSG
jgi:outer membrane protein assembly factor BamB